MTAIPKISGVTNAGGNGTGRTVATATITASPTTATAMAQRPPMRVRSSTATQATAPMAQAAATTTCRATAATAKSARSASPGGTGPLRAAGTYAYGAQDSGRGYQRQYDPYLDRNAGYESRPFNPYRDEFGGDYERQGYGAGRDHHHRHGDDHRGFWQKAQDEVASWMGDREALERRMQDERGSHYGKGPKGYRRSDDRIRDDVSDRLSDDHWLDASDIEVRVENGEVTLTGTVTDRDSKRRAERLAEGCGGVIDVQNNIKMRSATSTTSADNSGIGINTKLDEQARGRA